MSKMLFYILIILIGKFLSLHLQKNRLMRKNMHRKKILLLKLREWLTFQIVISLKLFLLVAMMKLKHKFRWRKTSNRTGKTRLLLIMHISLLIPNLKTVSRLISTRVLLMEMKLKSLASNLVLKNWKIYKRDKSELSKALHCLLLATWCPNSGSQTSIHTRIKLD